MVGLSLDSKGANNKISASFTINQKHETSAGKI